jgi:hypothetical protein
MTFINKVPGGPQANGPLDFADTLMGSGNFSVPEPASVVLLDLGLAGFVLWTINSRRRKWKKPTSRIFKTA